ncbi:MAG TPA: glycosyltransferase family 39 protein [Steroidobacter sp.]|jgi:4-amino-4-deoxy-L-arabinose transferase-like glycosyltransferase|nr:glycosyltransferase family 39 protein [Steroidobacter sp.]
MSLAERLLRPGRSGPREVRLDILWLLGLSLLAIAAGLGLRDPWPADEPRFALIARDMVATGQWLIPQVGGEVYADKPPLFFWIVGCFLLLTGSLRVALLLPGMLAGLGVVALTYDLARRLWDRTIGLVAGLALLATVQFVWQARQGQIDATLCFFTTLSVYGLLRHLLLGPAWRWYFLAWAAAGLGVITKGVGFLPVLMLLPYGLARARNWISPSADGSASGRWKWRLGPVAMLGAISLWLAPMLIASSGDPVIARYRDEILFGQTIHRYAGAWHHREPFWYFMVQVVPFLWLPLIALVPWLWKHWLASWRSRDMRVLLPLAWVMLVLVFFSLSSGKRGVYVLPAVPAFVLACAPFAPELMRCRGPRNTLFGITCGLMLAVFGAAMYLLVDEARRQQVATAYDIDVVGPLSAIALAGAGMCVLARPRRAFAAYAGVLLATLLIVSYWVNPVMNDARSGASFMRRVKDLAPRDKELGLVAYKEQYLLYLDRAIVNFGHARWREYEQEAADAAAWLAADPQGRVLLVDERARQLCFSTASARAVAVANRMQWSLVSGAPQADCVARGRIEAARVYSPPTLAEKAP